MQVGINAPIDVSQTYWPLDNIHGTYKSTDMTKTPPQQISERDVVVPHVRYVYAFMSCGLSIVICKLCMREIQRVNLSLRVLNILGNFNLGGENILHGKL